MRTIQQVYNDALYVADAKSRTLILGELHRIAIEDERTRLERAVLDAAVDQHEDQFFEDGSSNLFLAVEALIEFNGYFPKETSPSDT